MSPSLHVRQPLWPLPASLSSSHCAKELSWFSLSTFFFPLPTAWINRPPNSSQLASAYPFSRPSSRVSSLKALQPMLLLLHPCPLGPCGLSCGRVLSCTPPGREMSTCFFFSACLLSPAPWKPAHLWAGTMSKWSALNAPHCGE